MSDQLSLTRDVGRPKDEHGRFYTPSALAEIIVDELEFETFGPSLIVEPSVGAGAFVGPLRARWPGAAIVGVDVDAGAPGLAGCDAAHVGDWPVVASGWMFGRRPDLVVGNPPFTRSTGRTNDKGELIMEACAHLHVEAALALRPRVLAFILPWSYAGGVDRWAELLERHPPALLRPIAPRPWTRDVRETALYVWLEGVTTTTWSPLPRWR